MTSTNISRRQVLLSLPGLMMAPRLFSQAGNPPIRVKGINHVTLHVSDVKRSVDFYQGLFGMPIINGQGTTSAGLQIGAGPQHLGVNSAAGGAPKIDHICFAVEDFNVDQIVNILTQRGFTKSDEIGPMRVRVRLRDPGAGGSNEGTPELYFGDPDGIAIQLQDSRYCGGSGPLGNVCSAPKPSPKRGLLALKGWSHCTNFVSDAARANKFYQDLFGLRVQASQGPNAPLLSLNNGVEFVMLFVGGDGGRGAAADAGPRGSINHLCMNVDNFDPDAVIKGLESYGIKPRGNAQGTPGALVHYISLRLENRGGAKRRNAGTVFHRSRWPADPTSGFEILRWRRVVGRCVPGLNHSADGFLTAYPS
jgi:catechol 2,3-dioxygenase-like lactoylglutathione lyase family enzyme